MKELTNDYIRRFALGGKSLITLQSGNTGVHFTYSIQRSANDNNLYFIKLLNGQDNTKDYTYIGCYYSDNSYFNPAKKYKGADKMSWPPSLRAIEYFLRVIDNVPDNLKVFHEGRCGVCGRRLTTPDSIERGIGPECLKRC